MELCVDLVTRPRPGTGTRIVVLIILIVTVAVLSRAGYDLPGTITVVLGAGLTGAAVAPALAPAETAGEIHP
ncbi:MAG TPA: hypothetical protein VMV92_33920 [Streptosporangiaceae bacterium]|nr:hypothetical protein [Streptosporangiaceae bacterium]